MGIRNIPKSVDGQTLALAHLAHRKIDPIKAIYDKKKHCNLPKDFLLAVALRAAIEEVRRDHFHYIFPTSGQQLWSSYSHRVKLQN